ncbi:riboflavin synthase, partial [Candidatus Gottesmanbacteria bacterium]|nr:riboflavin synthase [Candidatus Gottesmanbacteria bacterium]
MKEGERLLYPEEFTPKICLQIVWGEGVFFMFTGIISCLGKLEAMKGSRFIFSARDTSFFAKIGRGGSVAINGICLTLIAKPDIRRFSVEVMPETRKKTMIGTLQVGDSVNLELPVSPNDLFAGHLVQGHVDGTATIAAIEP